MSLDHEADEVSAVIQELINEGHTIGVFSHHIDATTSLSDELTERGIDHEIIGLPECLSAALDAQNAMVQFSGGATNWKRVQQRLAVFVTSSVRGDKVPDLARMLLGQQTPPGALTQRLDALHADLQDDEPTDAVARATAAHAALGLPRGENHWQRAARLLRPLLTRHLRRATDLTEALHNLNAAVIEHRTSLLTYAARQPGMQQRPMLEKVQMPPRLLHRVMHRTTTMRAILGRTPEPSTTITIQIQIQLGGLGAELGPRHPATARTAPTPP